MDDQPVILIPARLASIRLPRKPLADIAGLPMIVQVWHRAMEARCGRVVVAAAEAEIVDAITLAGGEAVLTDPDLPSGSDRIHQALEHIDPDGAHQRTAADQARYDRAAAAMLPLYGSALGTTVVRLRAARATHPYDSRGWCYLESVAAAEVVCRAAHVAELAAALERLPPKLIELGGRVDGRRGA